MSTPHSSISIPKPPAHGDTRDNGKEIFCTCHKCPGGAYRKARTFRDHNPANQKLQPSAKRQRLGDGSAALTAPLPSSLAPLPPLSAPPRSISLGKRQLDEAELDTTGTGSVVGDYVAEPDGADFSTPDPDYGDHQLHPVDSSPPLGQFNPATDLRGDSEPQDNPPELEDGDNMQAPAHDTRDTPLSPSGTLSNASSRDNPGILYSQWQPTYQWEQIPLEDIKIPKLRTSLMYLECLRNASSKNTLMKPDDFAAMLDPPQEQLKIEDEDLRTSLELFLELKDTSEKRYEGVCRTFLRRLPSANLLSFYQVTQRIARITGISPIQSDMCIKTCCAFTGPLDKLDQCPFTDCQEPRFETDSRGKKEPRRVFETIPIGPVLQALWRHPDMAKRMKYRRRFTDELLSKVNPETGELQVDEYVDVFSGSEYIRLVRDKKIKWSDMVLMQSIDGAQLYAHKSSDCWFYIWIILDVDPVDRSTKVLVIPGGTIGGPNKPRLVESFTYVGLHELAIIQKEGLKIWDSSAPKGSEEENFVSYPFHYLSTADAPGQIHMSGYVPHHGKQGCRSFCGLEGSNKPGGSHYYPILLKPTNHPSYSGQSDVELGSLRLDLSSSATHVAYDNAVCAILRARNEADYKRIQTAVGITKPSLLTALPRSLGAPGLFPQDLMHYILNMGDLFSKLWLGTLKCEAPDSVETWDWAIFRNDETFASHGAYVAECVDYLPGFYDRSPRDPNLKLNSQYKAKEYLHWLFGLGPALLYGILPEKYYSNYCKLVQGIRIMHGRVISRSDVIHAFKLLSEFEKEFEEIYYQRKVERIHFVRQSIHNPLHLAYETTRVGPPSYYAQWTMERVIGDLGSQIKQPKDPYANVSERATLRAQENALRWMDPTLHPDPKSATAITQASRNIGDKFVLRAKCDSKETIVTEDEDLALRSCIRAYWPHVSLDNSRLAVRRWARLELPSGHVSRSLWIEQTKCRRRRNIKFKNKSTGREEFAEVQYFFQLRKNRHDKSEQPITFAMVSVYSDPDKVLLKETFDTVWSCSYLGQDNLRVIEAKDIVEVVALVAFPPYGKGGIIDPAARERTAGKFFVYEKLGLDHIGKDSLTEVENDDDLDGTEHSNE